MTKQRCVQILNPVSPKIQYFLNRFTVMGITNTNPSTVIELFLPSGALKTVWLQTNTCPRQRILIGFQLLESIRDGVSSCIVPLDFHTPSFFATGKINLSILSEKSLCLWQRVHSFAFTATTCDCRNDPVSLSVHFIFACRISLFCWILVLFQKPCSWAYQWRKLIIVCQF